MAEQNRKYSYISLQSGVACKLGLIPTGAPHLLVVQDRGYSGVVMVSHHEGVNVGISVVNGISNNLNNLTFTIQEDSDGYGLYITHVADRPAFKYRIQAL